MLKKTKNFILDLLLPRLCIGCGKQDTWLCEWCFHLISPNKEQVCYICRNPSPYGITCQDHLTSTHQPCPERSRKLDRLLVAAHYSGNPILTKAIHSVKYERHPEDIADKLGQLLFMTFKNNFPKTQNTIRIIPIPLHKKRLKERGFNQAELISKALLHHLVFSGITGLIIETDLIFRSRHTSSQVETNSRENRLENLKGAFSLNDTPVPEVIYLLVDDVTTTGSTLEECCQLLKENGAKEVWGLVLARN